MASSSKDFKHVEPEDQRQRILRIAASLFADKGYSEVGVAEIGSAVGLGRGALYYHIGSKEELLYDIVIQYIVELVATGSQILRLHTNSHDRITQLSRHLMNTIANNLSELTVCFREAESLTGERHIAVARLHSDYQSLWAKALEDGYHKGEFRRLPNVALKGLLGMYFYSFLWLNPTGQNSADDIADIFADIVKRAAAPDRPRIN